MMATYRPASELVRAPTKQCPSIVHSPAPVIEPADSGGGLGSANDLPACPGARSACFTLDFCNIRGLRSNFSSVELYLHSSSPHLLFLTETQVSLESDPKEYSVSSYSLYSNFSFKTGCCAYVRKDVSCSRVSNLESSIFSTLWLRLSCQSTTKFICCVYLSPTTTDYPKFFQYLNSKLEHIISISPFSEVIILGDFNVHHREWLSSPVTDIPGILTREFAILNDLEQLVHTPTRVPDRCADVSNILDLFLTSNPSPYTIKSLPPLGTSDHTLISVSSPFISSSSSELPPPSERRRLWHFNAANWNDLRRHFSDFPWDDYCFRGEFDSSECASRITDVIFEAMEGYIPYSFSSSKPSKSWFNSDCARAVRLRDDAFRDYRRLLSSDSHTKYISLRNRAKTILRNTKKSFIQNKCNNLLGSASSRPFWHLSKNINSNFTSSSIPPLQLPDGSTAPTSSSKAEVFVQTFASNSTLDDSDATPPILPPSNFSIPEIIITYSDVVSALTELDSQKAYGPDGIPPLVLKSCARQLAPCLLRLFRLCLSSGSFPSCWKRALIQPVPKKGDPSLPSNYRPIALTSILSKVFESIINRKIWGCDEFSKSISDRQYGFRKERSTGDLLTLLSDSWSTTIRNFGETFAVALDISKAFDRVWHKALISKLPSYGFYPSLCNLISDFLSGRSIAVMVEGHRSSFKSINSGVPQGSVLSPTLFLIFINDLLSCTISDIHSYADDTTLHYSLPHNKNTLTQAELAVARETAYAQLNSDLSSIADWGKRNLVVFNASKTQFLHLSTKKNLPHDYPIFFEGTQLKPSSALNILGVSFSPTLSFKEHIVSLSKNASKKLGVMRRLRGYFSPSQLLALYRGVVRPCMEYSSHVWGGSCQSHLQLLDKVESKAFHLINSPILTDNLQTLSERRSVATLSLFYRYYNKHCSSELANHVGKSYKPVRETRWTSSVHSHIIRPFCPRLNICKRSFLYRSVSMWNTLPSDVFPALYNINIFKRRVSGWVGHVT